MKHIVAILIPVILTVAGVFAVKYWLSRDPTAEIEPRFIGGDGRPKQAVDANEPIKIAGKLTQSDGVPADIPGAWPRFRGADYDAIGKENTKLARSWPEAGPEVLWSVEVGDGYAAPAVRDGRVYFIDYDLKNNADVIRCLSLQDAKEIWSYSYPVKIKDNHGRSRAIPTVTEKYLVAIGPKCHVTCLDSDTGEFRWMYNLVAEFGTKIPGWYTSQCPLVEDDKALIAPGGETLMMAVDCNSGDIIWKTDEPNDWVMTHSCIVPMEFAGKRFYIYAGGDQAKGGVVGVSAEDGKVLWRHDEWRVRFNVPTPVVIPPDRIFLTSGYAQTQKGCTMLRLAESAGRITVKAEFLHPTRVFGSIQQTPIFYKDHLYGVRPDGQLVCLDLDGNVVWTSTSANKFGSGPFTIADDVMYVMNDSGTLTLVRPSPSAYTQFARAEIFDAHESWGPMPVVSGRLIVRDRHTMMCLDIAAK